MNKSSNNQRLPRAKGIDMGTYYTPKECAKKVRHLVLPDMNRKIVEEFITILGMREDLKNIKFPFPIKWLCMVHRAQENTYGILYGANAGASTYPGQT